MVWFILSNEKSKFLSMANSPGRCFFIIILSVRRSIMSDSVYKIIELVGTSEKSWEDAAKNAVESAGKKLKDLRIAEIVKLDMTVEDGKVALYRSRVNVSFKYHGNE
jgi:flavin-binding protein dodecin